MELAARRVHHPRGGGEATENDVPPALAQPATRVADALGVGLVTALALSLTLWGIRGSLPFSREIDEGIYVEATAATMVDKADPNPHWFGNPGSTIIYPLAGIFEIRQILEVQGRPGGAGSLEAMLRSNPSELYLIGRLLVALFGAMTVPLVYLIGARAYGRRVGLVAALGTATYPLIIRYGQMVRTDTAAMFFGLLGLWLMVSSGDKPRRWRSLAIGAAIGLAVATRYFMVSLIVVFALREVLLAKRQARPYPWHDLWYGLVAAIATFVITTPYFFLDFSTALGNLANEARGSHPGADGLSPIGNAAWYLVRAIPNSVTLPQALAAVAGLGLVCWRRTVNQTTILLYGLTFIGIISLTALHWQRWILPILPVASLLAADALLTATHWAAQTLTLRHAYESVVLIGGCTLLIWQPLHDAVLVQRAQSAPSTKLKAREWMIAHAATADRIGFEFASGAFFDLDPRIHTAFYFGRLGNLDIYRHGGFEYLIINDDWHRAIAADAERFPDAARFYRELLTSATLVASFTSPVSCPPTIDDPTCGSPTIKIFRL